MLLGTEVIGLGTGEFALDGGSTCPHEKGTAPPPTFAVCGRKQICVRSLRSMSIVAKRLITGSSSMAGARTPPPGLGKDACSRLRGVSRQSAVRVDA